MFRQRRLALLGAEIYVTSLFLSGILVAALVGSATLAEFASAVDAVECAAEIQRAMPDREEETPTDRRIAFRIGNRNRLAAVRLVRQLTQVWRQFTRHDIGERRTQGEFIEQVFLPRNAFGAQEVCRTIVE